MKSKLSRRISCLKAKTKIKTTARMICLYSARNAKLKIWRWTICPKSSLPKREPRSFWQFLVKFSVGLLCLWKRSYFDDRPSFIWLRFWCVCFCLNVFSSLDYCISIIQQEIELFPWVHSCIQPFFFDLFNGMHWIRISSTTKNRAHLASHSLCEIYAIIFGSLGLRPNSLGRGIRFLCGLCSKGLVHYHRIVWDMCKGVSISSRVASCEFWQIKKINWRSSF